MVPFEKTQRFSPLVFAVVILVVAGLALLPALLGEPTDAAGFIVVPAGLIGGLYFGAPMRTRVDRQGVDIRTLFIVRRRIAFSDVASANAVRYRPLRDYGGWGYRVGRRGKAYNMRGDRGVELTMRDGRSVLIGSQRPDELEAAINKGLAT